MNNTDFRGKLFYDQVLDILKTSNFPAVDALASPILDTTIVNQISNHQTKKYDKERGKELVSVQCGLLMPLTSFAAYMTG